MIMYPTLCQMKCLEHIKPQEKLCEGKLNSKQKVLYGHLSLVFLPILLPQQESSESKDDKQNPVYLFDLD